MLNMFSLILFMDNVSSNCPRILFLHRAILETIFRRSQTPLPSPRRTFQAYFFSISIIKGKSPLSKRQMWLSRTENGRGWVDFLSYWLPELERALFWTPFQYRALLIPFLISSSVYSIGILKRKLGSKELIVQRF